MFKQVLADSNNFPNNEIRDSFYKQLLNEFGSNLQNRIKENNTKVADALDNKNIPEFIDAVRACFSSIPYHTFVHNKNEGFYHAALHMLLYGLNIPAGSEIHTNKGRIDILITRDNTIYVLELKHNNKQDNEALDQIKKNKYYEKYLHQDKDIVLMGVHFSNNDQVRNINQVDYEIYNQDGNTINPLEKLSF